MLYSARELSLWWNKYPYFYKFIFFHTSLNKKIEKVSKYKILCNSRFLMYIFSILPPVLFLQPISHFLFNSKPSNLFWNPNISGQFSLCYHTWLKIRFSPNCTKTIFCLLFPNDIDILTPQMLTTYENLQSHLSRWYFSTVRAVSNKDICLGILSVSPCLLMFVVQLCIKYFCIN